jgi:SAM-dependent methyltransferase
MLKRTLHDLFDRPAVFDAYQLLVDGGKGRRIRAFLRDVPYASVLDIGCGTGNWATTARGRYLGVDISIRFVEAARARYAHDPRKQFEVIDPAGRDVPGRFDLVQMVSVLHHLSDEEVRDVLQRVMRRGRYLFVLDLYPIRWHPLSRLLYAADRGDFIRGPAEQERLIREAANLRLLKRGDFFAPTTLYRHTLFLFERT